MLYINNRTYINQYIAKAEQNDILGSLHKYQKKPNQFKTDYKLKNQPKESASSEAR